MKKIILICTVVFLLFVIIFMAFNINNELSSDESSDDNSSDDNSSSVSPSIIPSAASKNSDTTESSDFSDNSLSEPSYEASSDVTTEELSSDQTSSDETTVDKSSDDSSLPEETSVVVVQKVFEFEINDGDNSSANQAELGSLLDEIRELIAAEAPRGHIVSFLYKNYETGFEISYNKNRQLAAVSLTKLPFAISLIYGGADLEEKLILTEEDKKVSGPLFDAEVGAEYNVYNLIYQSLRFSDNTAYEMLRKRFGVTLYNIYCDDIGIKPSADKWAAFGYVDVMRYGKVLDFLYDNRDNGYYAKIYDWLIRSTHTTQLAAAFPDYKVAHKFGFIQNEKSHVYHDAGIIFAESPFAFTMLTNMTEDKKTANEFFVSVSVLIGKINSLISGK